MARIIEINKNVYGVEAEYKEQIIEEYKGNPLIEALPDILDKVDVIDKLTSYPAFNENERNLDAKYRFHIAQRLFKFFQPLSVHLDLESKISRIIRQGYISRNPIETKFIKMLNKGFETIKNNNIDIFDNQGMSTTAEALYVVGDSGMGKSVSIQKIMSLYPQIIVHCEYKGITFSQYQITYLKLDCPFDGSIKGLSLDFLIKIDDILGTNYYKSYRRSSANAILPIIAQISRRCSLGILIIDEIQNISLLKAGGAEKMLNFFMSLINTVGVPVLLVGTNKAMSILQAQFRQARRGIGQGAVFYERIKNSSDTSWKIFAESLFEFQWIKNPCELTQEITEILYEESQGIYDIAVKLFVMSQIYAISTNKEEITPYTIRHIAKENLTLIKPALEALKSGNINRIAQYEDITPINIDEFINKQSNQLEMNSKIREFQKVKLKKTTTNNYVKEEAVLKLLDLDVTPAKAKKAVETIVNDNPTILNVNEIVKQAYVLIIEAKEPTKTKKKKTQIEYVDNDLRSIVVEGKKNKLSAYESLFDKGFIKPYLCS